MKTIKRITIEKEILELREIQRSGLVAVFSSLHNTAVTPWYRSEFHMPLEIRRLFKAYEVRS